MLYNKKPNPYIKIIATIDQSLVIFSRLKILIFVNWAVFFYLN